MDTLSLHISLLPKDLQIIIGEYNVEHRPKMKETINDITYNYYYTYLCFVCQTIKIGLCHLSNGISDKKLCSKRCCAKYKSSSYELVHIKGYKTMRLEYDVEDYM